MISRKLVMALSWKIQRRDKCSRKAAVKAAWAWAKGKQPKPKPPASPLEAARAAANAAHADYVQAVRWAGADETILAPLRAAWRAALDVVDRLEAPAPAGSAGERCMLPIEAQRAGKVSPRCACKACAGAHDRRKGKAFRAYSASSGGW